jgi:hypothetical protein
LSAGGGNRLLDEGNAKLLVVLDAERLQFFVAFSDVGVTAAREVATVNVSACERVTDAVLAIEMGFEKLLLFRLWELCKRLRGRIGERAADAQKRLERLRGIDEDADLCFEWLAVWV